MSCSAAKDKLRNMNRSRRKTIPVRSYNAGKIFRTREKQFEEVQGLIKKFPDFVFDIGAIVAQKKVDIGPHETLPELYIKLAKLGADVLGETMENLQQALRTAKPQIEENVTYAPKITSKISLIRWNEMSAKNVYDLQRALSGLYPLTTKFKDKTIKLLDIREIEKPVYADKFEVEAPGIVSFDKQSNVLAVKCKHETWICVKRIIVSGRPPMNARDFCNGFLSGKHKASIRFC